jgi:hypothetical protein
VAGSTFGGVYIYVNESTDLFSVGLTGVAATPNSYILSYDPSSYDFGSVAVGGSKSLIATVTNVGTGTVTFKSGYPQVFSLKSPDPFSMTGTTCGAALVPGASCTVTATFSPQVAGSTFGGVYIYVNESTDLFSVGLTGTGSEGIFSSGFEGL